MVAESNSANIFKIGLLVFEILHNQHFRMPYLLWFSSNCNGVWCSKWQNIPWIRSWKDFSNRTSRSKVMTKFQLICKCYAITCNTCIVYVYSFFSFGLSIHNSVNSRPNHFKISKVVVDRRTSGSRSITSSIYLNWNISVIYCQIEIKLVSIKAEWRWVLFRKNYFFKLLPVSQTWRH